MKLLSLAIQNWGPYQGEQVLDMETSPSAPVVLVEGENERGKTSLFFALRYALYGRMRDHDGREVGVADLANWDARDTQEAFWFGPVLLFEHKGERLELTRQVKGVGETGLSGPTVRILETRTQLRVVGGDPFPEKDIDGQIQRILHSDIASFFLFDGETLSRVERLLKSEDSASIYVRDSIERALGVPALRLLNDDVDELTETAGAEVRKAARAAKVSREAQDRLNKAEDELKRAEKDLADLSKLEKEAQASLDAANAQLAEVDAVKEAFFKRKALEDQVLGLEIEIEQADEAIRQILDDAWWLPLGDRLCDAATRAMDAVAEEAARAKSRVIKTDALIKIEQQLNDPTCHTCGQSMPAEALTNLERQKALLQKELSAKPGDESIDDLIARERRLRKFLNAQASRNQLQDHEAEVKRLRLRVMDCRGKIDRLTEAIQGNNLDIAALDAQANEASEHLVKISIYMNDAKTRKVNAVQMRKQATADIGKMTGLGGRKSNVELEVLKLLSGYLDESIGDFRNQMRQEIQSEASEIFRQLTTEPEYAGLRIDGNYYLSIVDSKDRIVARRSAGANQIVTLSLIGALARCAVEEGPIVMDTPFARLDTGHRRRVLTWTSAWGSQVVLFVQSGEFDRDRDLQYLAGRVGRAYALRRVGTNATRIESLNS
jgi:DNA sulfur modification protein DndD